MWAVRDDIYGEGSCWRAEKQARGLGDDVVQLKICILGYTLTPSLHHPVATLLESDIFDSAALTTFSASARTNNMQVEQCFTDEEEAELGARCGGKSHLSSPFSFFIPSRYRSLCVRVVFKGQGNVQHASGRSRHRRGAGV